MKKMMKIAAMFSLALSLVFTSTMPAEAAMTRSTLGNCWEFEFKDGDYNSSVYVGQTVGSILTNDIVGNTVTWKSSNKKIATVDSLGNVTGKKAGKVTISATDGVHTAKYKITVKALSKAKKNEVVLNYGRLFCVKPDKYYTVKTLKGSPVKKFDLRNVAWDVTTKGAKFKVNNGIAESNVPRVVLKNGKYTDLVLTRDKTVDDRYVAAMKIAKKGMVEFGVTKNSSELEKAMFVYNWMGTHVGVDGALGAKSHNCTSRGSYDALLEGYGDCDVCAEGVEVLAEACGLWTVAINVPTHQFNGIRVDGEWYVMDTMQCEAWEFCSGNPNFLSSYNRIVDHSKAMDFTINEKSLDDITFTSTKYDDKKWPEYYDLYEEANPYEEWDW